MDNLAILTGAGANASLGLPTLDQALNKLMELEDENSIEGAIIKELRERTVKGNRRLRSSANVEVIIGKLKGIFEIGEYLRNDPFIRKKLGITGNKEQDFIHMCRKALVKCYKMMLEGYGPKKILANDTKLKSLIKVYEACALCNASKELQVFTTNYDCTYQVASSLSKEILFYSNIDPGTRLFTADLYPREDRHSDIKVYIYRLHGCVAWVEEPVSAYRIREKPYADGTGELLIKEENLETIQIKLAPQSSFPTNPAFSKAYSDLEECLKKVKNLFVWGYSFRDQETVALMNFSSFLNQDLKIFFADPFKQELEIDENINRILTKVGRSRASNFKPKRLSWNNPDNFDELITLIKNEI